MILSSFFLSVCERVDRSVIYLLNEKKEKVIFVAAVRFGLISCVFSSGKKNVCSRENGTVFIIFV